MSVPRAAGDVANVEDSRGGWMPRPLAQQVVTVVGASSGIGWRRRSRWRCAGRRGARGQERGGARNSCRRGGAAGRAATGGPDRRRIRTSRRGGQRAPSCCSCKRSSDSARSRLPPRPRRPAPARVATRRADRRCAGRRDAAGLGGQVHGPGKDAAGGAPPRRTAASRPPAGTGRAPSRRYGGCWPPPSVPWNDPTTKEAA